MASYVNTIFSLPQARALLAAANEKVGDTPIHTEVDKDVLARARDRLAGEIRETEDK